MKIGDLITFAGHAWKVRPFTAAEHERFGALAEASGLQKLAAEAQALGSPRSSGARAALINADIKRLNQLLDAFTDGSGIPRSELTLEEREQAYGIASEIDMLTSQLDTLGQEPAVRRLLIDDQLLAARESVVIAFMHEVLEVETPLAEFAMALTPEDLLTLSEVVEMGKLPLGLSAYSRRQAGALERIMQMMPPESGGVSGPLPPPPDAPRKPGSSGRSKRSSSKSKASS